MHYQPQLVSLPEFWLPSTDINSSMVSMALLCQGSVALETSLDLSQTTSLETEILAAKLKRSAENKEFKLLGFINSGTWGSGLGNSANEMTVEMSTHIGVSRKWIPMNQPFISLHGQHGQSRCVRYHMFILSKNWYWNVHCFILFYQSFEVRSRWLTFSQFEGWILGFHGIFRGRYFMVSLRLHKAISGWGQVVQFTCSLKIIQNPLMFFFVCFLNFLRLLKRHIHRSQVQTKPWTVATFDLPKTSENPWFYMNFELLRIIQVIYLYISELRGGVSLTAPGLIECCILAKLTVACLEWNWRLVT